jgi:hypothetical protein
MVSSTSKDGFEVTVDYGVSEVANKKPFIGIIDVGPMCMKMNDTFHDSIKSQTPNNLNGK